MHDNPYEIPHSEDVLTVARPAGFTTATKVLLLLGILVVGAQFLLPNLQRGRGVAHRVQCCHNLRQIGLALHNYHDAYKCFPPAYTVDESGRPLHSWRTLLLPYLEQQALYSTIDLSRPWNDPVNKTAMETSLPCYRCPASDTTASHTSYLGIYGEHYFFAGDVSRCLSDTKDGAMKTLMVVEVPKALSIPWMSPQDANEQLMTQIRKPEEQSHAGGFQAVLADGSVRFLSSNIDEAVFQSLLTIDPGDIVGEF